VKLINAIAQSVASLGMAKDHDFSAYRFHSDLFLSGLERIILVSDYTPLVSFMSYIMGLCQISRKASATYYPTLHLELSRYINHAIQAGYELPYTVSRLIGSPPAAFRKNSQHATAATAPTSIPNLGQRLQPNITPSRPVLPPVFPSSRKVEPIRFD